MKRTWASYVVIPWMIVLSGCGDGDASAPNLDVPDGEVDGGASVVPDASPEGCEPHPISDFQPPPPKPPAQHQGACGGGLLAGFVADCITATDREQCRSSWQQGDEAHTACFGCMETPSEEAAWGPLVLNAYGRLTINFGGCFELADPVGGKSCSTYLQGMRACAEAACAPEWCPAHTEAEADVLQDCQADALNGDCAELAALGVGCLSDPSAGRDACYSGGWSTAETITRLGEIFCGTGITGN